MRIGPYSVNTFFIENCRNVTVWLGCEQHDALFGKIRFYALNQRDKKIQAPQDL
ncbi:Hypothetical protein AKI40_2143 [Enterobacter sp. FY-07]|nr:Hypothetical protein AKI40_2143 [Enterobacter sp. FY-07]